MKHSFRAMTLFAAIFALQSSQAAQPTKGESEVDYRQSLYTVIGGNFHPLGAMAEGKMPFNAADAKVPSSAAADSEGHSQAAEHRQPRRLSARTGGRQTALIAFWY